MPTYEYRCPEGHEFELFQKMTDEPVANCPTCGAKAERLLSGGAGFLFKGSGFYITDYRSESYKKKAASETGSGEGKEPPAGGSGTGGKAPEPGSSASKPSNDE